jgi:transcription antitermination factor NusG
MEIDAGASSDNPGTALSVPGTGPTYAVSAVFRSRNKGKGKMYQEVVPAYPGTDPSVPRTSLPMEIDYVSVEMMEIDQAVFTVREVPSWARPIMNFLVDGQVPTDETEARRVTRTSKGYTIINKEIYKRSTTGVLQKCVESAEGLEMLREIHQGECGHHASSRALVAKVFRHGFYWPTARSRRLGPEMQWVSKICPPDSSAGISVEDYPNNLALCCVGPGHGRTI